MTSFFYYAFGIPMVSIPPCLRISSSKNPPPPCPRNSENHLWYGINIFWNQGSTVCVKTCAWMIVGAQDSSKSNSKGVGQLNTIYLIVKLEKSEIIFVKKFHGLSTGRFMLLESFKIINTTMSDNGEGQRQGAWKLIIINHWMNLIFRPFSVICMLLLLFFVLWELIFVDVEKTLNIRLMLDKILKM